jgi:hypothetical protein
MADKDRETTPNLEDAGLSDETADQPQKQVTWSVGYGVPPAHTRFQKGRSGNPRGRPRKDADKAAIEPPSIRRIMLDEARRPITIKEGGKPFQISAKEAVMRAQVATAIRGSAYAQKNVLEQIERLEREEQREIAQSHDIWRRYIAHHRAEIAAAQRRGMTIPNPLPHPDDILIEPGLAVRIDGPLDTEDVSRLDEFCRLRSTLLLQDELDRRLASLNMQDLRRENGSGALLLAVLINNALPRRWQMTNVAMIQEQMRYQTSAKRDLLKTLYRRWRALGFNVSRGRCLPARSVVVKYVGFITGLWNAARKRQINLAAMAHGEFHAALREIMNESLLTE